MSSLSPSLSCSGCSHGAALHHASVPCHPPLPVSSPPDDLAPTTMVQAAAVTAVAAMETAEVAGGGTDTKIVVTSARHHLLQAQPQGRRAREC